MKLRASLIALVACLPLGCGDDPPAAFATFQECFDQHAEDEALPPTEAIVGCCLEHPIDGMSPACGATAPDCINYLTANLKQTSASTTEVSDACNDYAGQN